MNTRLFSLTLGLLATTAVASDEPAAPATAGYHLKNKASFVAAQSARSPFWPIGWTPTTKASTLPDAPATDFTLKPDQFSVTSILLGSQSLAVINGRTYGEGEFVRPSRALKPAEGAAPIVASANTLPANVKVRVSRIIDGQVILQAGGQSVSVPLKRQQLNEKKGNEDELLLGANADR